MPATILTIEDHADIRQLIRMTLEFDGYRVLEARDGATGLELARRHLPDMILLDVMMPGLSGLAVSRHLAEDARLQHIPVVMLTALDSEEDRLAGRAAGACEYLAKPFGPQQLLDLVARLTATAC